MRRSTILISLLFSLTACNQETEQSKKENMPLPDKVVTKPSSTTENLSVEKVKDEDRYPLFFIEVAKNLNMSTQEFAQAMRRAGDNDASMESVAKELGISVEELQAALPKRPPKKITFQPTGGKPIELKNLGTEKVEPTETNK